jgi:hypothetical protein
MIRFIPQRIFLFIVILIVSLFILPVHTRAQDISRPAITIINPVRGNGLGHKTDDLLASLKAQWQVTKDAGVRATWLFQYGALANSGMTQFAKTEMQGEEFGLLFEIDRDYAEKSGIAFRGQGAWYGSDGLFLDSYDRSERHKLIDTAFAKFKEVFGNYPKTVGAWWIGGDSLTYMQEKYGITAAMRASDQFNLDFYSIWGTPWDIPYLPSKANEGMPAASFEQSAKVVVLQWAIRDPVRGYADPLYSLQDYSAKGYTTDYVDYLASIYLQKPFGNFVIGLENGGTQEKFQQNYQTILYKAKEIQTSGKADILLARDYAQQYLSQKKVFAGSTYFLSTDYKSQDQSFWYMSPNYRALIVKTGDTVLLIDLRNYADKTREDFDIVPNTQQILRINEPAIIDSMQFPGQKIVIKTSSDPLTIHEQGDNVTLYAGSDKLASFTPGVFTMQDGKIFSFIQSKPGIYPLQILVALYIFYCALIWLYKKNLRIVWKEYLVLLIPLFVAIPFLVAGPTFLFDKQETLVLAVLSLFQLPVPVTVYLSKILPLLILIILHYAFMLRHAGNKKTRLYWGYYLFTVLLYAHIGYFPLDKTTYTAVVVPFAVLAAALVVFAVWIYRKHPSKRVLVCCGIAVPAILVACVLIVVFSRSTYALTPFELQALQEIKNQKKNVVYVEEADYSIRPIYRQVRPLFYANYWLAQLMSATKWEIVMRPESKVLTLSGYDGKLIVIPRYLGSDMSDYEMTSLHLTKIFDNTQIALFEK